MPPLPAIAHQRRAWAATARSGRSTDFDGDGRTDLFDAGLLAANLLGGSLDTRTDLDGCSVGGPTSLRDFAIFAAEFLRVNPDLPCR